MITPLGCGVDTLEVTFKGELPEDFVEELVRRKESAQFHSQPQELMLGGETFYLQPKGRGFYSFVCRNHDMDVAFGSKGLRYPMSVKMSAYGLASRGVSSLMHLAQVIGADVACHPHSVSRIDVKLDFQGWVPTFEEMRHVVCKSDFRPIYPGVDNPQTFQFGKGDAVVRVYDKTHECQSSGKSWWTMIWRLAPGFDESLPVWRAEVQVRGPVLRELGFHFPAEVLDNIGAIFDYGLRWASVRMPGADSNLGRCREHPRWEELRSFHAPLSPLGRVRKGRQLATYQSLVPRMLSLIESAALCTETEDFWTAASLLVDHAERSIQPMQADDGRKSSRDVAFAAGFKARLDARRRKVSGEF